VALAILIPAGDGEVGPLWATLFRTGRPSVRPLSREPARIAAGILAAIDAQQFLSLGDDVCCVAVATFAASRVALAILISASNGEVGPLWVTLFRTGLRSVRPLSREPARIAADILAAIDTRHLIKQSLGDD